MTTESEAAAAMGTFPVLRVLLVEDNPGDARLLRELLLDAAGHAGALLPAPQLRYAATLQEALNFLEQGECDAILLDLNLPDSIGLETFFKIRTMLPESVVVVLTGLADNRLAMEAIRHGAQDYLVKDRLDGDTLLRSLRYAIERQRLQLQLERIRQRQYQEQELQSLERLSEFRPGAGDSTELLRDYATLVQNYVRATRLHQPRPSAQVRLLAQRMAALPVRARDVVRLHIQVLESIGNWAKPADERGFASDARLVLVELMGHLIDIYQDQVAGVAHE